MRKIIQLCALLILAINTQLLYAESGSMYLLPKLGFMNLNLDDDANDLGSLGLLFGYGYSKNISFEGEINASTNLINDSWSGGEYETIKDGVLTNKGVYKVWTIAAYAAYRVPVFKSFYLKGKLGILYETIIRTDSIKAGTTTKDTGVAGGLGMGFYMGKKVTMELEATIIDQDITFYSLGLHIRF